MYVVMTGEKVSVHDANNVHVPTEHLDYAWKLSDFEAEFSVNAPNKIVQLNYEPERSLYVLTTKGENDGDEYVPHHFTSPDGHPVIQWIHTNLDAILKSAEYHVLRATSEYPGDDFTWDEAQSVWVKVEDPDKVKVDAERWLGGRAIEIAVALSYLWEAAEAKNVFDGVQIPAAVTSTITQIINHRGKIS